MDQKTVYPNYNNPKYNTSKYMMAKIQLAKLKYYPKLWMTEIYLGHDQEF